MISSTFVVLTTATKKRVMRYSSHHHNVGRNNNIPIRFRSLFIAIKVVPQPTFFLVQRQPLLRGNKKVREAGIFIAEAMLLIVCRDFINPSNFLGSLSGVLSLLQINPLRTTCC